MLLREQCEATKAATLPKKNPMDIEESRSVKGVAGIFSPTCVQARVQARCTCSGGRQVGKESPHHCESDAFACGVFLSIHTLHIEGEAFIHGAFNGKGCTFLNFTPFTQRAGGCKC